MRTWLVVFCMGCGASSGPPVADVAPASASGIATVEGSKASAPVTKASQDSAEAKRLFDEGIAAANAKNFSLSLDRFTKADALHHTPDTTYRIGEALENLGRPREAADTYEKYMKEGDLSYMDNMSMGLRVKQLRAKEP